jgi:hypothetical protein
MIGPFPMLILLRRLQQDLGMGTIFVTDPVYPAPGRMARCLRVADVLPSLIGEPAWKTTAHDRKIEIRRRHDRVDRDLARRGAA